MSEETLIHKLSAYCADGWLPMHMPGHKRSDAFPYLNDLSARCDITEIDSFDDLNCPHGVFLESERIAARLWGSDECIYSVNGSSGAIIASVRAALRCRTGEKVLMSRASHKSVYHAIELCGAVPVYIKQEITSDGFCASVSPENIKKALDENDGISLVIITSPTYEGVISDIASIARVCHEQGVPLLVDEAHGAHLSLYGLFPVGAVTCGADIVVHSLHKTLPSLTQTALLHVSGALVDRDELKRQMALFQTSSPSYILSASIDGAVRYLATASGKAMLTAWRDGVTRLREDLKQLKNLRVAVKRDGIFDYDPSKVVLCGGGAEIAKRFSQKHKIELEMSSPTYVIAMTGMGDTIDSLERFKRAAFDIDEEFFAVHCNTLYGELHLPTSLMTPAEAVCRDAQTCRIEDAAGRVSSAYVYAYPPGIPLITPGEVFDRETLSEIVHLISRGISLRGLCDGEVRVLSENNVGG